MQTGESVKTPHTSVVTCPAGLDWQPWTPPPPVPKSPFPPDDLQKLVETGSLQVGAVRLTFGRPVGESFALHIERVLANRTPPPPAEGVTSVSRSVITESIVYSGSKPSMRVFKQHPVSPKTVSRGD